MKKTKPSLPAEGNEVPQTRLQNLCALILTTALLCAISIPSVASADAPALFYQAQAVIVGDAAESNSWQWSKTPVMVNASAVNSEFSLELGGSNLTANPSGPQAAAIAADGGPATQITKGDLYEDGARVGRYTVSTVTTAAGDAIHGIFRRDDGRSFELENSADGYSLTELNHEGFPDCANDSHEHDLTPDGSYLALPATTDAVAYDSPTVDVMVAYTAAARSALGGESSMLAKINSAVSETNDAYTNSSASISVRLVHTVEVSDNSSGNFSTDLSNLRSDGDGDFDEVHDLRDTYGADLVVLITNETQYCGIAYLGPGSDSLGFSVVYHGCATGYFSFGHEIGHNLGLAHDPANAGGTGYKSTSHGWHFGPSGTDYRSIMAYSPGTRIQYFSNPAVTYLGYTTGDATQADNADTLDTTASMIAAYREEGSGGGSTGGGTSGGGSGGSGGTAYDLYLSKSKKTFTITLTDSDGSPISGETVQLKKNKKKKGKYKRSVGTGTTDANGQVIITTSKRGYFRAEHDSSGEISRVRKRKPLK